MAKETLYTVQIPDPNGWGLHVLTKDVKGKVFIAHECNADWRKINYYQLTEAEIKQDFEWAWKFAEPVDERLYTVELLRDNNNYIVLMRTLSGGIKLVDTENSYWKELDAYQLTEDEIKQNFDWAWKHAKVVI